jgi:RNA-directed DNA polymerase
MGRIKTNKTGLDKKSFDIPIEKVELAFYFVKQNRGCAWIDDQTIEDFEENLEWNIYKIWNRMSSWCYFPPPVKTVEIPKGNNETRKLWIPTVWDRIAQMVVKIALEPELEEHFHKDSYGYRPNKSALQAISQARQNCFKYDWVLDLDIKWFFDNIDHELALKAVREHTKEKWIIMYIERWLKAPGQDNKWNISDRNKWTPQWGVISPIIANLYLHYALDKYLEINCPTIPFERYADDGVYHCKTEKQAQWLLSVIKWRLKECWLELNKDKTKIAYCKDSCRKEMYKNENFDFLWYTFRPRKAMSKKWKAFTWFLPAMSNKAKSHIRKEMRELRIKSMTHKELKDIAKLVNPKLNGWINYFWEFYRTEVYRTMEYFDIILARWAMKKFNGRQSGFINAHKWILKVSREQPNLFPHWKLKARYWSIK